MDNNLYVLMSAGWEYNDEAYTPIEGGHPEKVFTDKENAKQKCQELNLKEFKDLFLSSEKYHSTIQDYCYHYDEILKNINIADNFCREHFKKSFHSMWDNFNDEEYKEVFENLSDEHWIQFMNCFNLNFWEVVVVEKGD